MSKLLDESIGWYGVVAILTAYTLNSFNLLSSQSFPYQILNGTGALGIVYISLKRKDYQPGVLNIIWAIIALISLIRISF